MEITAWIQNQDKYQPDFILKDGNFIPIENVDEQQKYVDFMYAVKDDSKKLFSSEELNIYRYKKDKRIFFMDLASDDLDEYGRKGAVMLLVKNFESHQNDRLTELINKTLTSTNSIVSDDVKNQILGILNKSVKDLKKGFSLNIRSALLISLLLLSLAILIYTLSNKKTAPEPISQPKNIRNNGLTK